MKINPHKWYNIYNQATARVVLLYIAMFVFLALVIFGVSSFPAWLNWTNWIALNILYIFNLYVWRKSRPDGVHSNAIVIVGIIMLLLFWVYVGFVNFMLLYNG